MSVVDSGDVELVDLAAVSPEPEALRRIPRRLAFRRNILCLSCDGNELTVAMPDVRDAEAIDLVRFETGMHVHTVRASMRQIRRRLHESYDEIEP